MSAHEINQEVRDQFLRVLKRFREAVQAFPENEWRTGESPYQRPAGLADHLLTTIDYYTSDLTAEEFPWNERLGVDWESPEDDTLATQSMILIYLDDMEERIREWMITTDLAAPEGLHPYTGQIKLGRALYLLRHCQHHFAELCLELHRRGIKAPEWL